LRDSHESASDTIAEIESRDIFQSLNRSSISATDSIILALARPFSKLRDPSSSIQYLIISLLISLLEITYFQKNDLSVLSLSIFE